MDKILIVDDEYWVGRWLREVLEGSPFEIEVASVCQDGEEAIRYLRQNQVDILITDINMPVVGGLDLIRYAELPGQKAPKAIVISGYDEFEYARQAIELDVVAYLIKPLERRSLFEAVEKALAGLNRERLQSHSAAQGYYASVENILVEFFHHPQDTLKQKLSEILDWKARGKRYYILGMIQNTRLETSRFPKEELKKKLQELCPGRQVFLFCEDPLTWGFLLAGIEKEKGFHIEENALLFLLRDYSWGVSRAHTDFMELDEASVEARNAMIERLRDKTDEKALLEAGVKSDVEFLAAIEARDKERVRRCSEAAEENFIKGSYDLTGCLNLYFVLTGEVIKMLTDSYRERRDEEILKLIEEGYEFSSQIRRYYGIKPICRKFLEYSFRVIDCLNENTSMTVGDIVQKVRRMIREQYAKDLNLGSIADEFSINPSYFSKKFKEGTGMNFVDYLAGVRIEQARSLLEHTDFSISHISAQVGFNDPKYFSKVFVAATGEKPSEYRARCRGERKE